MIRSLLIILIIILLNSCIYEVPLDRRLKIYNRTNRILYYSYEKDTIITYNPITLDSIIYKNNDTFFYGTKSYLIKPHEFVSLYNNGKWEEYLKICKNGVMSIYIYSEKDVLKYPFNMLKLNKKYLKRFDLSIDDIRRSKWIIEYNEK
jgi:hypothetical protein